MFNPKYIIKAKPTVDERMEIDKLRTNTHKNCFRRRKFCGHK